MFNVHYAVQVCDVFFNTTQKRYCGDDRTLLSKKSVTSLMNSIRYVVDGKEIEEASKIKHHVKFFDDQSTKELKDYLLKVKEEYSCDNIVIEIEEIDKSGIMYSIKKCYEWLHENGTGLVYQVQDDYLFEESAILEMIDFFQQIYADMGEHSIIYPFQDTYCWAVNYKYKQIVTRIVLGSKRMWNQIYDIPCTFMTSSKIFHENWDILKLFVLWDPLDSRLEIDTLNKILVDRKVLGFSPFISLALHIQRECEKDPYLDWKARWDSVKLL